MAKKESTMDGWRRFLDLCLLAKSRNQFEEVLQLFLTHQERRNVSKRMLLVNALLEGNLSQREIAHQFKISIARITRGSNALKIISGDLRSYLDTQKK